MMKRLYGPVTGQHLVPAPTDKKFTVGLDPLEEETKLTSIQPLSTDSQKRMLKIVSDAIASGKLDAATNKALRMWRANLKANRLKGWVNSEFQRDFWAWLLGRGREDDQNKCFWYRQSLADDPEVRAYIDSFIVKRMEYMTKLELLRRRRPIGINQTYLFFKYIVRGEENANEFLSDWKIFQEEFDVAVKKQYWMDNEQYVHPHEMAPWGKLRVDTRGKGSAVDAAFKPDDAPGGDGSSTGPVPPYVKPSGAPPVPPPQPPQPPNNNDNAVPPPGKGKEESEEPKMDYKSIVSELKNISSILKGDIENRRRPGGNTDGKKPPLDDTDDDEEKKKPRQDRAARRADKKGGGGGGVAAPVPVVVSDEQKKLYQETNNKLINLERANETERQRRQELEKKDAANTATIAQLEKRLESIEQRPTTMDTTEDDNDKEARDLRETLRSLQKEHADTQAHVASIAALNAQQQKHIQAIEKEQATREAAYQKAVQGHMQASVEFSRNASKAITEMAEALKSGNVKDAEKFEKQARQLQQQAADERLRMQQAHENNRRNYETEVNAKLQADIAKVARETKATYERALAETAKQHEAERLREKQAARDKAIELDKAAQTNAANLKASNWELMKQLRALPPPLAEKVQKASKVRLVAAERVETVQKTALPQVQEAATKLAAPIVAAPIVGKSSGKKLRAIGTNRVAATQSTVTPQAAKQITPPTPMDIEPEVETSVQEVSNQLQTQADDITARLNALRESTLWDTPDYAEHVVAADEAFRDVILNAHTTAAAETLQMERDFTLQWLESQEVAKESEALVERSVDRIEEGEKRTRDAVEESVDALEASVKSARQQLEAAEEMITLDQAYLEEQAALLAVEQEQAQQQRLLDEQRRQAEELEAEKIASQLTEQDRQAQAQLDALIAMEEEDDKLIAEATEMAVATEHDQNEAEKIVSAEAELIANAEENALSNAAERYTETVAQDMENEKAQRARERILQRKAKIADIQSQRKAFRTAMEKITAAAEARAEAKAMQQQYNMDLEQEVEAVAQKKQKLTAEKRAILEARKIVAKAHPRARPHYVKKAGAEKIGSTTPARLMQPVRNAPQSSGVHSAKSVRLPSGFQQEPGEGDVAETRQQFRSNLEMAEENAQWERDHPVEAAAMAAEEAEEELRRAEENMDKGKEEMSPIQERLPREREVETEFGEVAQKELAEMIAEQRKRRKK